MKRWLSLFTAAIVLVFSLGIEVCAGNGPMGPLQYGSETVSLAYVKFLETDETGALKRDENNALICKAAYANETVLNELSGASYDKTTNTLTITNLSADHMLLETNVMGDDFTLKVEGNCSIGRITLYGDGYGGSLHIEGDGTLTVNSKKLYDSAILLAAEYSGAALYLGEHVNLNLYAAKNAVEVIGTSVSTADKAVIFANGQSVSISESSYQYSNSKWLNGFDISDQSGATKLTKVTKEEDSGTYGAASTTQYPEGGSEGITGYTIYTLFYHEAQKAYFVHADDAVFVAASELEESEYALSSEEVWEPCYRTLNTQQVYQDQNGEEYVIKTQYTNEGMQETAMRFAPLEDTGLYLFTEDTAVNVSDLKEAEEIVTKEGFYNYIIAGTELTYKAGTTSSGSDPAPGGGTGTDQPSGGDTETTQPSGGTTGNAAPAKGDSFTDSASGGSYEVTKADAKNGTVAYTGTTNNKAKTVTIPATVTVDGVTYKVTSIEDNAFKGNKTITKVTIPKNVTTIGKNAFSGCTKLKTVSIGSRVTTVEANAFKGCKALTKITLPEKTTKIGANAFNGCKNLKTITIKSKKLTAKSISKNGFKGVSSKVTIKVPKGKAKTYRALFRKKGLNKKITVK